MTNTRHTETGVRVNIDDLKASAPRIPGETCPLIDRLSTMLSAIDGDFDTLIEEMARSRSSLVKGFADDLRDFGPNLADARLQAEELRGENEALRAAGRYWYQSARRLAGETDVPVVDASAERNKLDRILDDLEGLELPPADVARQARRIRTILGMTR